uniref:UDP-N-acetylmuramate--L-alanine ligase n=1 Tax=candidate division CPR3 bacterium TaxID=2268181 RepID=A0A7V3J9Y3_UNCC3
MKYHLIGINGTSMSGLAKILEAQGNQISGCDIERAKSKEKRLKIFQGHSRDHITKDLDGLIISAAITPSSGGWKEVERAQELGIPIIPRSKMIGRLMQDKVGIAVAGMHGKTTVSAMISLILEKAGLDPTFLIGGELPKFGNARSGKGEYFVVEACEYARQFLDMRPKIAVITNIEEEHLDTYPGGLKEIKKAFKKFVRLIPQNGLLVLWEEDPQTPWLAKCARCKVKTFSLKKPWPGLKLKIPGRHNILNATAAARVCHELGVPHKTIKMVLNDFNGVKRRFEMKGEVNGILVIDDYGHHPSEIQATLAGAREFYPKRRLICVFQPHQYARTKALFDDFAISFSNCDKLVITEIFAVPGREEKRDVTAQQLAEEIKKHQKNVVYLKTYQEIVDYLKKESKSGDLIITMGATKIYEVGEKLLQDLGFRNKG